MVGVSSRRISTFFYRSSIVSYLLSFLAWASFSFFVSGSDSASDLLLDMKDLSWFMELLFLISESFCMMRELPASWVSFWPWLHSAPSPFYLTLAAPPEVSNIPRCTPCTSWWSVCVGREVLFRCFHFAVHYDQMAVHFRLRSLGPAHRCFQPAEAFLAEYAIGYLTWALRPGLVRFLFLVLPAFSDEECYDCIWIIINEGRKVNENSTLKMGEEYK